MVAIPTPASVIVVSVITASVMVAIATCASVILVNAIVESSISAVEIVAIPVTSRLTAPKDSTFCEPVTLMLPSTNTSEKKELRPITDSSSPTYRSAVTVCRPTVATPIVASVIFA